MLGVENIKRLLKVGLDFGQKAAKALEDKKVSFFEAIGLIPEVFSVIGVAKSWSEVQNELNDLTDEEKKEIEDYVASEFSIPNEKVKTFIQHALMQVISVNALINEFKHIKDPV